MKRKFEHDGTWQPFGDQFLWACRICANVGSLKCAECKSEKKPGFEFDCYKYMKLCQEFSKESFFWDDKYWCIGGMRNSGKIFFLEQMLGHTRAELKEVREARDAYKQLADELSGIIKEMLRRGK
jgi:hypothetical protein